MKKEYIMNRSVVIVLTKKEIGAVNENENEKENEKEIDVEQEG